MLGTRTTGPGHSKLLVARPYNCVGHCRYLHSLTVETGIIGALAGAVTTMRRAAASNGRRGRGNHTIMFTVKICLMRFVLASRSRPPGYRLAARPQTRRNLRNDDRSPSPRPRGRRSRRPPTSATRVARHQGTGFDEGATIRLNGVVLTGERKFKAEKASSRSRCRPFGPAQPQPRTCSRSFRAISRRASSGSKATDKHR